MTPSLLVVACVLLRASAIGLRSEGSLESGNQGQSFWQWLFGGWGKQKHHSRSYDTQEYAVMSWQAATEKARSIALQMTPEEQFQVVGGSHNMERNYYVGNTVAFEKYGIPALRMQDSSNGFRTTEDDEFNTTTHFPCPLALGATWDEDLIERTAQAIGEEFKQKGANVVLGPSLNVHRIAAGGRNYEYMAGEDPYLGSRYAAPYIHGVQRQGLVAVAKHFAFNEQETNRYEESSEIDAGTAWNMYYPPFEAAVKAGVGSMMCSYNKVNGVHACGNGQLLRGDLRESMKFHGWVMSDWMATHSSLDITNGLSQEMNYGPPAHFTLAKFSEFGPVKLIEATTDVLTSIFRLGLDRDPNPPCGGHQPCTDVRYSNARSAKHTALAREAATASMVLLKNSNGTGPVLPLRAGPRKRLAIVGLPANARRGESSSSCPLTRLEEGMKSKDEYWACKKNMRADYYGGGGSGSVVGPDPVTPLEAIKERAEKLGIEVVNYTTKESMNAMNDSEVALGVDHVLVFAATTAVESIDRPTLKLDDHADDLISRFAKLAPTVVCMQTPGAVLTPWRDEVFGIANLFLAGEETAHAWAANLFGDHTPEAKLPIAMPASREDQIHYGKSKTIPYQEGIWSSYRNGYFKWAFPFGHGLSYTTFAYDEPEAFLGGTGGDDCEKVVCVRMQVSNTGAFAGREVVQAYLQFDDDTGFPMILRGFQKTELLQPGKSAEVSLDFGLRDLSIWMREYGWVPQPQFIIMIGSSSKDIRHMLNVTIPNSVPNKY
jgi:beta-glucosidase